MAVQQRVGMPMDEFIREFDAAPFELIDGMKVSIPPQVAIHAITLKKIFAALLMHEQRVGVDVVFAHAPFVFAEDNWVTRARLPDIIVFRNERLATYREETPDFADKPFLLVPDLCIEVASAADNYSDMVAKVDAYLADGVKLVWVVNPRSKSVLVYTQGSDQITRLTLGATLTGGDILPGFALPLKDIFPA